jgi:hypothetical protein
VPPLLFLGAAFPFPPAAAAQCGGEVRSSEIHLFLVCILLSRLELISLGRSCSPVPLVQSGQYQIDFILLILCDEFGQNLNTKVIDLFNTFPESIYSLILVEYSESYDYWKFAVSCG